MLKNKWRISAVMIACVMAYYGDAHETETARGSVVHPACAATSAGVETQAAGHSVAEAERQCNAIRNTSRRRQG